MSIVTFKKPIPFVSESDWHYRVSEIKASCNELRANTFQLKNDSNRLRDETDITTYWNTCHTNAAFVDRCAEITLWKNLIQLLYEDLKKEEEYMQDEKSQTEEVIEFLNLNFKITNHCMRIRDERGSADFCYDMVSKELDTEQNTLEKLKTMLTQICQAAWEQINKLQELRMNVAEDLDNKINTVCMDTKLTEMTKNSENIYLKNPLSNAKQSITYEKWLQLCNRLKHSINDELISSKKMRETMYQPRNKTKNDLRDQNDRINFALRRRIYETNRIKNELEWHKFNMTTDKDKFQEEIVNLEDALTRHLNSKKLVETRSVERTYRNGFELCTDKTEIELNKERFQLDNTIRILTDKLNQTKSKYNEIIEKNSAITMELSHKAHALKVDRKCMDYRKQLDGR